MSMIMAGAAKASATLWLSLLLICTTGETVRFVNSQVDNVDPQFVFVHGMGHGAWCFAPLITLLQGAGYKATGVDLTSHGINKAIADDVETVAQYIKPLTTFFENNISNSTIIVGHSLGGGPISVLTEMYPSKVKKAVFLAAIYPSNNKTFFSTMPPSTLARLTGAGDLSVLGSPPTSVRMNIANLTSYFYNKTPKQYVNLASTLIVPTPYRPGQEPLTLTAQNFGAARKFYVKTLNDMGITPTEQDEMISASPWAPERIYPIPKADHGVYFSRKAALSAILIDIAMTP